jgi:hypothetical protein
MKRVILAACLGILLAQAAPLAAQDPQQPKPVVLSADGRWRFAAESRAVAVFDATTGGRERTLPARALDGSGPGTVAALHALPARRSVLVVFDALLELWEVSTDPAAGPLYDGFVHDYKMGEGIAIPGFLNPRRIKLEAPLRDLVFDASQGWLIGRAPDRPDGRAVLQVWQLDVRRRIAEHLVTGRPQLDKARQFSVDGRALVQIPDAASDRVFTIAWPRP